MGDYWIMRSGEHAFLHICGLLEFQATRWSVWWRRARWFWLEFPFIPPGSHRSWMWAKSALRSCGTCSPWTWSTQWKVSANADEADFAQKGIRWFAVGAPATQHPDWAPERLWFVAVSCAPTWGINVSLCLGAIYWLVSALLFVFWLLEVSSSSSSLNYTFPHFPLLIVTEKLDVLIKINDWSLAPHLSKTHWITRPACCWATFWLCAWPCLVFLMTLFRCMAVHVKNTCFWNNLIF